jgi:hypothetical protein
VCAGIDLPDDFRNHESFFLDSIIPNGLSSHYMKVKMLKIAALGFMMMSSSFGATVSINFNGDFDTYVPQNFANSLGVPSNGMVWGILVDGSSNGLNPLYDNFAKVAGQSHVLTQAGTATDDVIYFAQSLTASTFGSTEGDLTTPGGDGGIYNITGITTDVNGVNTGDKFYVVWFDGQKGGLLGDASFIIPANGASVDLTAPFAGVDPIRTAGLYYIGTSGVPIGPSPFNPLPEPSVMLFGAIGVFGFLRRRRI